MNSYPSLLISPAYLIADLITTKRTHGSLISRWHSLVVRISTRGCARLRGSTIRIACLLSPPALEVKNGMNMVFVDPLSLYRYDSSQRYGETRSCRLLLRRYHDLDHFEYSSVLDIVLTLWILIYCTIRIYLTTENQQQIHVCSATNGTQQNVKPLLHDECIETSHRAFVQNFLPTLVILEHPRRSRDEHSLPLFLQRRTHLCHRRRSWAREN